MELGVSKEDYLKVIYQLTKQYGSARVNRIAEELNYTPASTSVAVNKLEALGFVQRNHDRSIVPSFRHRWRWSLRKSCLKNIIFWSDFSASLELRGTRPWRMRTKWSISSVIKVLRRSVRR